MPSGTAQERQAAGTSKKGPESLRVQKRFGGPFTLGRKLPGIEFVCLSGTWTAVAGCGKDERLILRAGECGPQGYPDMEFLADATIEAYVGTHSLHGVKYHTYRVKLESAAEGEEVVV